MLYWCCAQQKIIFICKIATIIMAVKFVHTADLHLGMPFKSLEKKSKLHRSDCQNTFSKIIDLCIKEKVNALLVAGDLFDLPGPSKSLVHSVIRGFKRLETENIKIFIVSGNHDRHQHGSVWQEYNFPENVIIFDSPELEAKRIEGLTVYGTAYTDDSTQPLKAFSADEENDVIVGLLHGSITNINWKDEDEAEYRPITIEQINNSGCDYIALGHFHNKLKLNTKVPCYYSGTPEGLNFKNSGNRYVLLISGSKSKLNVKPIAINTRTFTTIELDCTSLESEDDIKDILNEQKGTNNITRIILKGSPSLDFSFDIDKLLKEYENEYFFLKIVDSIHIPGNLTEDETIRGTFIKLVKDELKKTKDPQERKRLENALRIGIGYLDNKM